MWFSSKSEDARDFHVEGIKLIFLEEKTFQQREKKFSHFLAFNLLNVLSNSTEINLVFCTNLIKSKILSIGTLRPALEKWSDSFGGK